MAPFPPLPPKISFSFPLHKTRTGAAGACAGGARLRADLCDRPENDFFRSRKGEVRARRMRAPPSLADFFMRWPKLRFRSLG